MTVPPSQSWEAVKAGRELSVREVAVLRLARTHAVQAVDLTYTCPARGSSHGARK